MPNPNCKKALVRARFLSTSLASLPSLSECGTEAAKAKDSMVASAFLQNVSMVMF